MKKIIGGLVIVFNILVAGIQTYNIDYSKLDKIPKLRLVRLMSDEMSKNIKLPMKLDEITELTRIYSYNTSIIIIKKLDMNNVKLKKIWKEKRNKVIQNMLKIDSQTICYNPVWKYMIYKRNIIPEFNYLDMNNKPLFRYTIEIKDCYELK